MKIYKNPFVVEKYIDDELYIIYDDEVHILSGSAPFIWEKIGNEGIDKKLLLEEIIKEYDVIEKKAEKDLNKILSTFCSYKMIDYEGEYN